MSKPQRLYLVDVEQRVVSKYATGGGYWIQSFAFAEKTLAEALREGAKRAGFFAMALGVETRFVVNQACDRCGITGIEPGCKRKPCSSCGGTARRPFVEVAPSEKEEPTHPNGGYFHMGCHCRGCKP